MKRTHAAATAATASLMTAGVGGRIAADPAACQPTRPAVAVPVLPQARRALENIPKAGLFLGLRMQGGRMYAVNGSGGGDMDVMPRIITGPYTATPPVIRVRPRALTPLTPLIKPHFR